jgi:hypothetical protein
VASDDQVPADRLFDAFDTASARETAAFGAVGQLISNHEDAARELLERRLTDPELRCRAEARLDPPSSAAGRRGGLFRPMPTACPRE